MGRWRKRIRLRIMRARNLRWKKEQTNSIVIGTREKQNRKRQTKMPEHKPNEMRKTRHKGMKEMHDGIRFWLHRSIHACILLPFIPPSSIDVIHSVLNLSINPFSQSFMIPGQEARARRECTLTVALSFFYLSIYPFIPSSLFTCDHKAQAWRERASLNDLPALWSCSLPFPPFHHKHPSFLPSFLPFFSSSLPSELATNYEYEEERAAMDALLSLLPSFFPSPAHHPIHSLGRSLIGPSFLPLLTPGHEARARRERTSFDNLICCGRLSPDEDKEEKEERETRKEREETMRWEWWRGGREREEGNERNRKKGREWEWRWWRRNDGEDQNDEREREKRKRKERKKENEKEKRGKEKCGEGRQRNEERKRTRILWWSQLLRPTALIRQRQKEKERPRRARRSYTHEKMRAPVSLTLSPSLSFCFYFSSFRVLLFLLSPLCQIAIEEKRRKWRSRGNWRRMIMRKRGWMKRTTTTRTWWWWWRRRGRGRWQGGRR